MTPLIELKEVSKKYNKTTVVDGVSFKVNPSTINVLVGPNGAGKTTIAKILLGLEKHTHGEVIKIKNLKISYVPQGFKAKYEIPVLCSDFVSSLGLKKHDLYNSILKDNSRIDNIWNVPLSKLSGGMIQMLLLAIAFAQTPDLVILDEPTTYLDVDGESLFYKFIEEQRTHKKLGIFIISHDLHSVINTADQVLCLNHHLCCSGKPFTTFDSIETNIGLYRHIHNHNHVA